MRQSVIAVILNENRDRVLLIKRRDVPVWVLPGGGVDPGEPLEIAVIREIHEETGLEAIVSRKTAEYTPINRLATFTAVFECTPLRGELSTGDETADIRFFPIDDLPPTLFYIHQRWLQEALQNRETPIQAKLTYVTYANLMKYFLRHPIHVLRMLMSRLGIPLNN